MQTLEFAWRIIIYYFKCKNSNMLKRYFLILSRRLLVASILPDSLKFFSIISLPYSMSIRLSILKVSNPYTILEISFTWSLAFILVKPALILEPTALMQSYKGFVDLLLSLRYLFVGVLSSEAVKHSSLKLSFVAYFVFRIVEFSSAVHFVIFPLSLIGLSIG